MSKSRDAFRTISEVADWMDTPAHVLRFWESKFTQVKPVKRAGGRRYYRPVDMELLGGIKKLLHDDGMTIKGVQKILREQGVKHVASLCVQPVDADAEKAQAIEAPFAEVEVPDDDDTVVAFAPEQAEPAPVPEVEAAADIDTTAPEQATDLSVDAPLPDVKTQKQDDAPSGLSEDTADVQTEPAPAEDIADIAAHSDDMPEADMAPDADIAMEAPAPEPEPISARQADEDAEKTDPAPLSQNAEQLDFPIFDAPDKPESLEPEPEPEQPAEQPASALPRFLRPSAQLSTPAPEDPTPAQSAPVSDDMPAPAPAPKPPVTPQAVRSGPGALASLSRIKVLDPAFAAELAPHVKKLRRLVEDRSA